MFLYWFAMVLAVTANVFYHLSQKSIRVEAHPLVSLMVTYLVAFTASALLLPFFPLKNSLLVELKTLNWASYTLGLAILGLEVGFLLAYRAGWNISIAAVYSNVAVAVVLIPLGLFLFAEQLNVYNSAGLILAILSIFLMSK